MNEKLPAIMSVATLLASGIFIAMFVVVAVVRMTFPFELEWMEGGCVDQVARVLAGEPLYVEPSLEFTSYIYAPLYFHVSAAFAAVMGTGFLALRLVSILSTLGCMAFIVQIVRRETGSVASGFVASGLFAATYQLSGDWFDIARVDSLFMLLVLLSVFFMRRRQDASHLAMAAVTLFLAFLTKQTAILVGVPLSLYTLVSMRGRLRFLFPALFIFLCAAGVIGLHHVSDGWSTYYLFELPGQHWLRREMFFDFWAFDVLRPLAVSVVASVIAIALLWKRASRHDAVFLTCLFAGLIGASWSSRLHSGGWLNCLIPAHAALALGTGTGIALMLDEFRASGNRLGQILVHGLCLAQLMGLIYSPQHKVPSREDARAGQSMVRVMSRIEGPVLVLNHGYYPALAGKPRHSQGMAVHDVLRSQDQEIKDKLLFEFRSAIQHEQFGAIITSERGLNEDWFISDINRHYVHRGDLTNDDQTFWTVSGHRMRPQGVYVLRH